MKPYGKQKGASMPGKVRSHRNCSVCNPDNPMTGTARQRNKKICLEDHKDFINEQARALLDS